MRHQAAGAPRQSAGEPRGGDAGAGTGQHGAGGGQRVHPGEDLLLDLQALGQVFLHVRRIRQRLLQRRFPTDAGHRPGGIVQQALVLQQLRQLGDQAQGARRGLRIAIPEADLAAAPRKDDRPGLPDEPRAHHRHFHHAVSSIHLAAPLPRRPARPGAGGAKARPARAAVPAQTSCWVWPSTTSVWPLTPAAAPLAANSAMLAMSRAVTMWPREAWFSYRAAISSTGRPRIFALASITARMRGPSTAPGRMALTRMPSLPSSIASVLVKPTTAHLEAA